MDTQTYAPGQGQAQGKGGPIANMPLPNLSGTANGAIGESHLRETSSVVLGLGRGGIKMTG